MSFVMKFGTNVYKSSLRLLQTTLAIQQITPAAITSNRSYHIMTNLRTVGAIGPTTGIGSGTYSIPDVKGIESGMQRLLTPFTSLLTQVAGFKVKGRLRRRCKDCYFVMRQQRLYVICPTHPRHKQMAMKKREKNTWILTHATQSKVRPY